MSQSITESPAESSLPSVVVAESSTSVTVTTPSNGQSTTSHDLVVNPQQPNSTTSTGGTAVDQQHPQLQLWWTSAMEMASAVNTDRGVPVSHQDVETFEKLFDMKDGHRRLREVMSKLITEGSPERKAALL